LSIIQHEKCVVFDNGSNSSKNRQKYGCQEVRLPPGLENGFEKFKFLGF